MIRGVHAMLYSDKSAEVRAFLRDTLELPFIDAGEGWLIFDTPASEIGCHPLMEGQKSGVHEVSLMTDDVAATVETLRAKGVEFKGPVEDRGWGLATELVLPDGSALTIYQPRYR